MKQMLATAPTVAIPLGNAFIALGGTIAAPGLRQLMK